jgi:ABC-type transporter lipoprotein component MlaA
MKRSVMAGLVAAVFFGMIAPAQLTVQADEVQIDAVRKALEKYKDPYVAVRDLYLSTVACVHYDGSTEEGHLNYPKGAMGIHFVNLRSKGLLIP